MNLYNMILADDTIKPEELARLYEIGNRHGITTNEFNQLLQNPVEFKAPSSIEQKVEYLYDLVMIIKADGVVDANEMITLKRFCKKFGFEEHNIEGIVGFLMEQAENGATIDMVLKQIKE